MKKDNYRYNSTETCPNKDCRSILGHEFNEAEIDGFPSYDGEFALECPHCGWTESRACFMCTYNIGIEETSDTCEGCTRKEVS